MTLVWPWSLLGLLVVLVAALWALYRPGREQAMVGSLAIWQQVLGNLSRKVTNPSRRITASWLLLLAGAAAAVMAASQPQANFSSPARRVTVAVLASAELADDMPETRAAVESFLARLAPEDKVKLLLPSPGGFEARELSPSGARAAISELAIMPALASDLPTLPPPDDHQYIFSPAGADITPAPNRTVFELATKPRATAEAAAVAMPDKRVQLFLAVTNAAKGGKVWITSVAPDVNVHERQVQLAASAERQEFVVDLPSRKAFIVNIDGTGSPFAGAYLARRQSTRIKVALVGRDEPMLRRFVQAHGGMVMSPADQAELIIANGVDAVAGKPAILIDPPTSLPGWRRGGEVGPVLLKNAKVDAADELLRGMSLTNIAVRRAQPWVASDAAKAQSPLMLDQDALLIKRSPGAGMAGQVYLAFDISPANSNLSMSSDFVVLLANCVNWLLPEQGKLAVERYESQTPLEAGQRHDWIRLGKSDLRAHGLVPGLYEQAGSSELHAVSLPGLGAQRQPYAASGPSSSPADVPLPQAQVLGRNVQLWPAMIAIAAMLWLGGWRLRLR